MISNILLCSASVPLAIAKFGFTDSARYKKKRYAMYALAGLLVMASCYIRHFASRYQDMMLRCAHAEVTWHEAEYFAAQTFTTIGYGYSISSPPCDPNNLLAPAEQQELREAFYQLANLSMIIWVLQGLIIVPVLIDYVKSVFPHK